MYKKLSEIYSSTLPPMSEAELEEIENYLSPNTIPKELVNLLLCFNGSIDPVREVGFYSSEQIVEEHKSFTQLFKSADYVYPSSLVPIFTNGGAVVYFVKAENDKEHNKHVWSFCAGDGDREVYLEYESIEKMAQTLIQENEIKNTNKYPGTEGHYIDTDAFSEVQVKLNPNKYNLKQKGIKSPTGVQNVYEIESLHHVWG